MEMCFVVKIWLNILAFMNYALAAAIYLQDWSLNKDVKKWRKHFPKDLMLIYLICGIASLIIALITLISAHYLTVLLAYESNQHHAVDEMIELLDEKPNQIVKK